MKILSVVILSLTVLISSCRDDRFWVKGEGPDVTNTRRVASFKGISLSMSADVEIVRDSTFSIEITGQQNIQDVIETKVSGNNLSIYVDYGTHLRKHNPVKLTVHVPYLERLEVSGSGDITMLDDFNSVNLSSSVSGSGSISMRGNVSNQFTANISGSGDIYHSGQGLCTSEKLTISGSGSINAEWMMAKSVDANISGSGDQRVYAVERLEAHVSGSGSVYYRGNPTVNSHISGSGKTVKIQ